jgi:hypothetical protein
MHGLIRYWFKINKLITKRIKLIRNVIKHLLFFLEMGLFPSIEISEIDEGNYESVITIRDDVPCINGNHQEH